MASRQEKQEKRRSEVSPEIKEKQTRLAAESRAVHRLVYWIVGIIAALLVIIGLMTYRYVKQSLKPLDATDDKRVTVTVPIGSSNKEIAARLQSHNVIKSATVFSYYVKMHNFTDFQAGKYYFSPSMTLDQIITQLQKGHSQRKIVGKVLIKEGVMVADIAKTVGKNTKWSEKDFLALMTNEKFLQSLEKKYPKLLKSSMDSKDVRYHLEGYLFPLTYSVYEGETLKELVTEMVKSTDERLASYYSAIAGKNLTVQQTLTLASLVEREGVQETDRKKIAGVFFNRLAIDMPIQSDISVMYALNTHKESLTNKDTAVDSPYNLYVHTGYGPGPFNSPSLQSIRAVLSPSDQDQNYLYFVANLKTGKVYYSHTYEEHLQTNSSIGQ
ncbi:endolytic transglycosylase MltG [Lapidilactobacillus mulanensis]|uniref:Endolytic murein transglycosylase n=1 Tax=Lapidilactobacillus mulanensis TaxID=2485999 RepID=A0ABW4DR81_9LACO